MLERRIESSKKKGTIKVKKKRPPAADLALASATDHFGEEDIDHCGRSFPNGGSSRDGRVAISGEDAERPNVEGRIDGCR